MLPEAQDGLVTLIKASPLGKKLRAVDVLPVASSQQLLQKFFADAPGIYVDVGGFSDTSDRVTKIEIGVLLIAKNARGAKASQQGDGMLIGLLEMADAAAGLLDGASAGEITWNVERCIALDNFEDRPFVAHGLVAMSMKVCGRAALPEPVNEEDLDAFLTMVADYDIEPHASGDVHQGWVAEPKDTSGGEPDLSSNIQLEQ